MNEGIYKGSRVTYIDISEDEVFMADPSTPVAELAKIMVEHWTDSIFIVNKNEEILGIVTDGIMLRLISSSKHVEGLSASDIMATPVYCVKDTDAIVPFEKLKETFSKKHNRVNRVAIINKDNKIVGVVNMAFLKKIGKFSRSFEITLKKRGTKDE
nr:CBS domain-containing protein [Candidatus Sigynarchaeota archaeon]